MSIGGVACSLWTSKAIITRLLISLIGHSKNSFGEPCQHQWHVDMSQKTWERLFFVGEPPAKENAALPIFFG